MRESPRVRRLRSDYESMRTLASESSILHFRVGPTVVQGAPEFYTIEFHGRGLFRDPATKRMRIAERHQVEIKLTASYPRSIPDLKWKTPLFHPNVSAGGVICLGGYGTHWTPGLTLDEMCQMLWDMVRYANFDVDSPYNREAAEWAKAQDDVRFPVDARPLRDLIVGRQDPAVIDAEISSDVDVPAESSSESSPGGEPHIPEAESIDPPAAPADSEDIVDAEVLFLDDASPAPRRSQGASSDSAESGILFLE